MYSLSRSEVARLQRVFNGDSDVAVQDGDDMAAIIFALYVLTFRNVEQYHAATTVF